MQEDAEAVSKMYEVCPYGPDVCRAPGRRHLHVNGIYLQV